MEELTTRSKEMIAASKRALKARVDGDSDWRENKAWVSEIRVIQDQIEELKPPTVMGEYDRAHEASTMAIKAREWWIAGGGE